jgi:hypothetical protein
VAEESGVIRNAGNLYQVHLGFESRVFRRELLVLGLERVQGVLSGLVSFSANAAYFEASRAKRSSFLSST